MPEKMSILFPMLALASLTFAVLLLIPVRRFRAGFAGQIVADDFRYGESARVPPEVALPNRNLMNLLELPVLFYADAAKLMLRTHIEASKAEVRKITIHKLHSARPVAGAL